MSRIASLHWQRALHWAIAHLDRYRTSSSSRGSHPASNESYNPSHMQTLRLRPFFLPNSSSLDHHQHRRHSRPHMTPRRAGARAQPPSWRFLQDPPANAPTANAPTAEAPPAETPPAVHADHTRRGERLWRLGLTILSIGTSAHVGRAARQVARKAVRDLSTSLHSGETRGSDPPHAIEALRRPMLDAALAVARSVRLRPTLLPSRRHGQSVEREAVRVRMRSWFNATEAAARLLPPVPQSLAFPRGLPVTLRPCSPELRRWQRWITAESSGSGSTTTTVTGSDGRAAACVAAPAAHKSFRLAASPCLCLAAGPSKPLREPSDHPLAQLQPCDTAPAVRLARGSTKPKEAWELWTETAADASSAPSSLIDDGTEGLVTPSAQAPSAQAPAPSSDARSSVGRTGRLRHGRRRSGASIRNAITGAVGIGESNEAAGLARQLRRLFEAFQRASAIDASSGLAAASSSASGNGNHNRSYAGTGALTSGATSGAAATASAFGGKHGEWRRLHADPAALFTRCVATALSARHDKAVRDCEAWCRPSNRRRHCRACKCQACTGCTGTGSAAGGNSNGTTKDGGATAASSNGRAAEGQAADGQTTDGELLFGLHDWSIPRPGGSQLCLSVWKDDPLDGAPLTFAPCERARRGRGRRRSSARRRHEQQQWSLVSGGRIFSKSEPQLCVTATPIHSE